MLPFESHGDVGRLAEQPRPTCGSGGSTFSHGFVFVVGRFLPAAEHHDDAPVGIEPDDHVRPLVDRPDVVVLVDAHGVWAKDHA